MEINVKDRVLSRRLPDFQYPGEDTLFLVSILAVGVLFFFISASTLLLGALITLVFGALSYMRMQQDHSALVAAQLDLPPELRQRIHRLSEEAAYRLQVEPVNVLVSGNNNLNAYAFGAGSPKDIVLFLPLVQLLDDEELQSVIGHEMGHVLFGHTTLHTYIGRLDGVSGNLWINYLLSLIFRAWGRSCEYTADRAAVLACGEPHKAISAHLKLASQGKARTDEDLTEVLQQVRAREQAPGSAAAEILRTHPLTSKRVDQMYQWSQTAGYQKLQQKANENAKI